MMEISRGPVHEEIVRQHREDPDQPGVCELCTWLGVSGTPGVPTAWPCATDKWHTYRESLNRVY